MRLALVQMSNAGSIESNLVKSINAIKEASRQGADLVLFPEMQLTEFFPQYRLQDVTAYQVTLDSDIVKRFCAACKENYRANKRCSKDGVSSHIKNRRWHKCTVQV